MKKWLLVIMSVLIALGIPVHSLAEGEETITQDSTEKSGKISIDYNIGEAYTVVIPASVTFTDTEKTVERPLQVTDVLIHEGTSLNVSVASHNDFKMKNDEGYIGYNLRVNYNDTIVKNNYTILTVNAGEHVGLAILTFATELKKDHALYAGKYTDTLTFMVSVD